MTIGYTIILFLLYDMIKYIEYNQALGSKLSSHVHKLYVIVHPVDNKLYIPFIYPDLYQHILASY